jgi:hypothetical protein
MDASERPLNGKVQWLSERTPLSIGDGRVFDECGVHSIRVQNAEEMHAGRSGGLMRALLLATIGAGLMVADGAPPPARQNLKI